MMDLVVFVVFSCWLAPALASADDKDYDSDFNYDYWSLRVGGLIFSVVLFMIGIVLIVTRKCNCSKSKEAASRGSDAAPTDVPYSVKVEKDC